MYSRILILTLTVVSLHLWTTESFAQRGRRGGSGDFGIVDILRGLDTNKNGMLDLSESNGRTREFVQRAGLNPNGIHSIAAIGKALEKKQQEKEDEKLKKISKTSTSSSNSAKRKIPGFGVENERLGIKDFSLSGEERMSPQVMQSKFGDSVMSQVKRTFDRYDKDKNGQIDPEEQQRTRWSNPSAEESDTNNDGNLSRLEMAYRYQKREEDSKNRIESRRSPSKSSSSKVPSSRDTSNPSSYRSRGRRGSRGSSSESNQSSSRTSSNRSSSSNANSATSGGNSKRFDSSKQDAYRKYAEGLFKNYDKDNDGRLSKQEQGEMRRPPKDADVNKDGFVSKSELITSVTRRSNGGGSASDQASGALNNKRRSPSKNYAKTDSVFGGKDTNGDGQLQMAEFAAAWTARMVTEFQQKDRNNDGILSVDEWEN